MSIGTALEVFEPHQPPPRPRLISGARAQQTPKTPRIVAIGGGTGLPSVLEGLCGQQTSADAPADAITAIVTVTDDGGSSGRLRREYGVLPPGDVRNCLAAFVKAGSPFKQLLQHRMGDAAHPVGNLLLTALTQITGSFPEAVTQLGEMIGLRGRVLPTTGEDVRLRAEMECGQVLTGETAIVEKRRAIRRLSLDPSPRPLPEVLRALVNADAIVVGPGSLYTSTLPNLLVEGIASTISGVNAVRIYVANLMTEPGETDGFSLDDHLRVIREHTGFDLFDYILVNRRPMPAALVDKYASQGSQPVRCDRPLVWGGRAKIVEADFACEALLDRGKIRHEPASLAAGIRALVDAGRP
ncbi:MAG TPA: gluconeogenesis factor YvcK family protein [Vicinamibacterales bacterium]|nr:gluconeogenesis factor YvcK family protein [Vicinamibacterales bacterium]